MFTDAPPRKGKPPGSRETMRTPVKKTTLLSGLFFTRLSTNTATISTCNILSFRIRGIREGSTNGLPRFTTMPAAHLPSGYSGSPQRTDDGASTGRAPIVVRGKIGLLSDDRAQNH